MLELTVPFTAVLLWWQATTSSVPPMTVVRRAERLRIGVPRDLDGPRCEQNTINPSNPPKNTKRLKVTVKRLKQQHENSATLRRRAPRLDAMQQEEVLRVFLSVFFFCERSESPKKILHDNPTCITLHLTPFSLPLPFFLPLPPPVSPTSPTGPLRSHPSAVPGAHRDSGR